MAWIELKAEDGDPDIWQQAQKLATTLGVKVRVYQNGSMNSFLPGLISQPMTTELDMLKIENERLQKENQRFMDWYSNKYQPWVDQFSSQLVQRGITLGGGSENVEIPMAPALNGRRQIKLRD